MSRKDYFISGIREQLRILEELMDSVEKKKILRTSECEQYSKVTRQVERNLSKLRKTAAQDFLKEVNRKV